jgi:hypothetical protein
VSCCYFDGAYVPDGRSEVAAVGSVTKIKNYGQIGNGESAS